MMIKEIFGHPSIGEMLINLANKGETELAARLYTLIERLNLDPSGKNTPGISVCEFKEFRKTFFIQIVYRAKLTPFVKTDLSTHYRIFIICDKDLCCNIYLFFGFRNYRENILSRIRCRYWEFEFTLKNKYLHGEIPLWRSQ